jgi:hypothetical protein
VLCTEWPLVGAVCKYIKELFGNATGTKECKSLGICHVHSCFGVTMCGLTLASRRPGSVVVFFFLTIYKSTYVDLRAKICKSYVIGCRKL